MHGGIRTLLTVCLLSHLITCDDIADFRVSVTKGDLSLHPILFADSRFTKSSLTSMMSVRSDDDRWGGLSSLIVSRNGSSWVGVSDAGNIVFGRLSLTSSTLNCTSVSLVDDQSGTPLFAESIATVSGLELTDPGTDGLYVRLESSVPIRMYPAIDPTQYQGLVFNQAFEDPLVLCPAELKNEVDTCPPTRGWQSIESITEEPGQSTGSILFICERPSETDGLIHGWACNPSTGDSWQLVVETEPGWNIADIAFCAACEPSQVFFLSYNSTAFAVDTVLASTLVRSGSVVGRPGDSSGSRIRLLEATFPHPAQMHSLSVLADSAESDKLRLFVASRNEGNETLILSFSVELLPALAEALEGADSDSLSLSLIVLSVLLALGIILPIIINRNERLKARLQEMFTGKPQYAVRLNPVDAELSPPRAVMLENPSMLGKRAKRVSGETAPLQVVIE